jgi:hypothetical protein
MEEEDHRITALGDRDENPESDQYTTPPQLHRQFTGFRYWNPLKSAALTENRFPPILNQFLARQKLINRSNRSISNSTRSYFSYVPELLQLHLRGTQNFSDSF